MEMKFGDVRSRTDPVRGTMTTDWVQMWGKVLKGKEGEVYVLDHSPDFIDSDTYTRVDSSIDEVPFQGEMERVQVKMQMQLLSLWF